MKRKLLPLLLLFLLICVGLADAVRAERLPVKIYTNADGLGTSAIFRVVRDTRGFIWFCSRDGLIRFDGHSFITYKIGADNADPSVFGMLPTREGVYWINLNRGQDYRFTEQDSSRLLAPIQQQLAKNDYRVPLNVEPVNQLPPFEARSGMIWSFDKKGIYQTRDVNGHLELKLVELFLPGIPESGLTSINFYDASDGSLWIGTNWGLVRRLPDGRQIHLTLQPKDNSDQTLFLTEDKSGRIWVGRPDGLMVLKVPPLKELEGPSNAERRVAIKHGVSPDGRIHLPEAPDEAASFSFDDILRDDQVKALGPESGLKPMFYGMLGASDGKVWITSNRGLILFDGGSFRVFTARHGLGTGTFTSMAEDDLGHIWMSSETGVLRLNPRGLVSFDEADGFERARVHSIFEDSSHQLQVISGNWNIESLRNGVFAGSRPALGDDAILTWNSDAALLDSYGDWWILTQKKIFHYAGITNPNELKNRRPTSIYDAANGLPEGQYYRAFEDSHGDIWLSTWPKGLTRWQRSTGTLQTFSAQDGLPNSTVSALREDRAGNLWIGFVEGGMIRYRDGRFTPINPQSGVVPTSVVNLFLDSAARLWITSARAGLSRVDDPGSDHPVFKTYSIADGLTSNNTRCVTEDRFGNIYIGTVRGINRLTPATGRIKYFGNTDGLANDFVNVAYRDHGGALWFGTSNGLSRLIPEPEVPLPAPPILISALRIAGVDYAVSPLGQREAFVPEQSANHNNLQIDFMSTGSGADSATRYQYKLEGAGSDWSEPTALASISLANLSAGKYRFLVRAINADGLVSDQPAALSFIILRPIWQRWWFLTLVALVMIGIAYALYRYRVAQLLKVERVRTRIATDLHDDIGASLSRMAILSEVVKQQTVGDNGHQTAPLLTEIADSARELVDSMGDIVWSIDPRRDDLQSVVRRIRQFASDVLEAKGIVWELRVPLEVESLKLDPEARQHLFLIFKEGINNVARHAEDTKSVALSIRVEGRQLIGEIKDDGSGFVPQAPNEARLKGRGGNGLSNMRERATQMKGRLDIASAPGAGTTLTLKVPMK